MVQTGEIEASNQVIETGALEARVKAGKVANDRRVEITASGCDWRAAGLRPGT